MKKIRINQEDISNFVAEKIFHEIADVFDWMEIEIGKESQYIFIIPA